MGKKQYIRSFNSTIPVIGLELEFYLLNKGCKIFSSNHLIDKFLSDFSNQLNFKIEKEQGDGQIEVKTSPSSDIKSVIQNLILIKKVINEIADKLEIEASFSAQPFIDDCGSALQINLSLWDDDNQNLFSKNNEGESDLLLNSIAGILSFTDEILLVATKEEDLLRYDLDLNLNLFKKQKYTAPVNISWGYDNRTCLIRIPKSINPADRRIEYRLAPANTEVELLINLLLEAVKYGIENNLNPMQPIYGNAFDKSYNLKNLLHQTSNI